MSVFPVGFENAYSAMTGVGMETGAVDGAGKAGAIVNPGEDTTVHPGKKTPMSSRSRLSNAKTHISADSGISLSL